MSSIPVPVRPGIRAGRAGQKDVTSEGDSHRESDIRESRSLFSRPINRKVFYWVGISLWAIAEFFLDPKGIWQTRSRLKEPWTSNPFLRSVGIVVILGLLWLGLRLYRAKKERRRESSTSIDPT